MYRYVILGAGRQGRAAAIDLIRHGEARSLAILDSEEDRAQSVAKELQARFAHCQVTSVASGVEGGRLVPVLREADGCLSAVPYRYNPRIAAACVEAGCHHADLGGDPATVQEVLELGGAAQEAGVSLVPDCGLAPGLSNMLAARAIQLAQKRSGAAGDRWRLTIRCGGLPLQPSGPLGYALVFSPWGLLKEYQGEVPVIRDGSLESRPALDEVEEIEFAEPPGQCEAFLTVGGASTIPSSFGSQLEFFDYKTVRYKGHCASVRLLHDLGLLGEEPVPAALGEGEVPPRSLLVTLLEKALPREVPDLVVLRARVQGPGVAITLDLRELGDEDLGVSAMERCTGYPAAALLYAQVRGEVSPGAAPPELAVSPERYLEDVATRGISVSVLEGE